MPTNLGHEAITAKLGHADPSMYLGHEQIYPNNVSINSFAFTDTSTVAVTGATRVLNVGGQIGSTFNFLPQISFSFDNSVILSVIKSNLTFSNFPVLVNTFIYNYIKYFLK